MTKKPLLKKINNIFISALALSTVIGCSGRNNFAYQQLPYNQNQVFNNSFNSFASGSSTTNLPILVTFNNTYKITTEDNEKDSRNYSQNPDKYFIGLINSAKSTIDGAFYDIEDMDIAQAFITAHKRGIKIRIVTDTDNLTDKDNPTLPRPAVTAIVNAGIPVIDDKRSGIMHHKFMVVDNKIVWSGSMNLTTSSMYHHNNNSILINSPQLAENYNAEFKRLYEQGIFGPNKHEIPYPEVKVADASIRLYFSPKGGTQDAVREELKKAQKSIKFMTFSLTDTETRDIILQKHKSGVKVEGIFDDCMARNSYSLYRPFVQNKIASLRDGNQALLHHKVFVIDDQTVITGSFNYSKNAESSNNENTLVINSPRLAQFYNSEYFRLAKASREHKNIPPYDHPACGGGSDSSD